VKPRIRLLHQLGRSGGTLISRCLGSMQGVVLLSEIHPFTPFVRVDQYLSFRRMRLLRGISVGDYLAGYRRFAGQCLEIGFTRFEDFCVDPDWHLRSLCRRLDVPFDPGYRTRWVDYETITGDRLTKRLIEPVQRKHAPLELMDELRRCPDYRPLMEMLGYAP